MKKHLMLIGLIFLTSTLAIAQTKPKSKQKEAAPTQKELEEMMKEAQKEMEALDPESKRMMDSLGIKMPTFTMPDVTDAQLQEAYENESRIVPKRDDARIASISKTPLTNATVAAFLSGAHTKVTTRITSASKSKGEEIYKLIKTQYNSPTATGNSAAGLWMMGKSELALYLMGRACLDNPTHGGNLNNYAAMLSMNGGEQLAIPVLELLNKRYPGNTTILNNIGQAWFGLGEIDKANNYLESAIRIYAYHPQANFTKSFIEESKGQQATAVEAARRSIKKTFTPEKQSRLNNLGYELKGDDLSWDQPMPQDPLGLEGFNSPEYPGSVIASERLEKEWDAFKEKCQAEINSLQNTQKTLEAKMVDANTKRIQLVLKAGNEGSMVSPLPPFAPKAFVKLKYLIEGPDGHIEVSFQKKATAVAQAMTEAGKLETNLEAELKAIDEKYEDQFGEGKPNPMETVCRLENEAKNKFLSAANPLLQEAYTDYLNFLRRMISDETYYYQYTMWPEEFEVAKVSAKIRWLSTIRDQKPMFQNKSSWCQPVGPEQLKPFKLAAFDDVACKYHSQFKTVVGSITTDCGRMTTQLDLKFLKLGLKQDMDKNTFGDQFMSCSVEIGAGTSAGVDAGPLKAEASIGGSMAAEFDRTGLKDVIVKATASVSAGTDVIKDGSMAGVGVSDLSLDVGVKGQISIISGVSSMQGTGLLDRSN